MNTKTYEVIIIGGGPAGMSAALVLGRSRITTLILNTESPRNIVTTHSHGFLTQDGKHPNGIYFYILQAGNNIETKNMVLMKQTQQLSVVSPTPAY